MQRRTFVSVLGVITGWPLVIAAQQTGRVRRIGVLLPFPEDDPFTRAIRDAFAQALQRLGWSDGQNIRVDYRFAAGDPLRFKSSGAELVALVPDVILAGTPQGVRAVHEQLATIPIVFVLVVDPVGQGFVQSLARPGGHITGFSNNDASLVGKWLELLKEIAPGTTRVAVIFNPDTTAPSFFHIPIEAAGPPLGVAVKLLPVHEEAAVEEAIAAQAREPGGGLICLPDSFAVSHRHAFIAAAEKHKLPLIGPIALFPRSGALMSYFFDVIDLFSRAATYVDRILRGERAADLPVQEATKFELVINLKTAKSLGLTVPYSLLTRADEVIE